MVKQLAGFMICVVALCLPWRLRVLFAEALGWCFQAVYWLYWSSLRMLLKHLKPQQGPDNGK